MPEEKKPTEKPAEGVRAALPEETEKPVPENAASNEEGKEDQA